MYMYYSMDYIVDIKCLYTRRHCSIMKALCLLFFSKKLLLGALSLLFSVPKTIESGLAPRPNAIRSAYQARPKSLLTGVGSGLVTTPNVIGSCSQPDPWLLGPAFNQTQISSIFFPLYIYFLFFYVNFFFIKRK